MNIDFTDNEWKKIYIAIVYALTNPYIHPETYRILREVQTKITTALTSKDA